MGIQIEVMHAIFQFLSAAWWFYTTLVNALVTICVFPPLVVLSCNTMLAFCADLNPTFDPDLQHLHANAFIPASVHHAIEFTQAASDETTFRLLGTRRVGSASHHASQHDDDDIVLIERETEGMPAY
ncbi:unnamed protein product [Jaminaea pallidilutea]